MKFSSMLAIQTNRKSPKTLKGRVLGDRLKSLLESGLYSDCTIVTEDEILKSHKFLLALASPVFERYFYGAFSTNEFTVQFATRTMVTILKYAYLQPLDAMMRKEAEEVMEAAKFFEMNGLLEKCRESLQLEEKV